MILFMNIWHVKNLIMFTVFHQMEWSNALKFKEPTVQAFKFET